MKLQSTQILLASITACVLGGFVPAADIRPPAVPLVACDPYFSIWSPADHLTDTDTVHWTGKPHRLATVVRIDGNPYRVMGGQPEDIPAMKQTGLAVSPTRTVYIFESAGVSLSVTFQTPVLPEYIDWLARPITYVTYTFRATDQKTHTQNRDDFNALVNPVVAFLNETPDRVPMTDWYFTTTARRRGFTARPVVGGVFLQMLYDKEVWSKYSRRDRIQAMNWAPIPKPTRTEPSVPTS